MKIKYLLERTLTMNETFEVKKHISELNPEISDENDKNEKNTPPITSWKTQS